MRNTTTMIGADPSAIYHDSYYGRVASRALDALHDACGWTLPECVRFVKHDRNAHPVLKLGLTLAR